MRENTDDVNAIIREHYPTFEPEYAHIRNIDDLVSATISSLNAQTTSRKVAKRPRHLRYKKMTRPIWGKYNLKTSDMRKELLWVIVNVVALVFANDAFVVTAVISTSQMLHLRMSKIPDTHYHVYLTTFALSKRSKLFSADDVLSHIEKDACLTGLKKSVICKNRHGEECTISKIKVQRALGALKGMGLLEEGNAEQYSFVE